MGAGGGPYRDAYRAVAAAPDAAQPGDLVARLRARTSEGAPGNLALDGVAARIACERASWARRQATFTAALAALTSGAPELVAIEEAPPPPATPESQSQPAPAPSSTLQRDI